MKKPYQDAENAKKYLNFLASENGQLQREFLSQAILENLGREKGQKILDAACGPGWLAKRTSYIFPNVVGCDISEELVNYAKKTYPGIEFITADLETALPYPDGGFDSVILNMAGPDLENLPAAFKNISAKLKNSGRLIITVPNPACAYPVGVWKRSMADVLLGRKPKLILRPYAGPKKIQREFAPGQAIASYFYSLDDYINTAGPAGLILARTVEIKSRTDSEKFNLRYQLYRYPLILLLEFTKTGKSLISNHFTNVKRLLIAAN